MELYPLPFFCKLINHARASDVRPDDIFRLPKSSFFKKLTTVLYPSRVLGLTPIFCEIYNSTKANTVISPRLIASLSCLSFMIRAIFSRNDSSFFPFTAGSFGTNRVEYTYLDLPNSSTYL